MTASIKRLITAAGRPELRKLDALHQRHTGEECYIFGDGVSLKWMDLRAFTDRPVILGAFSLFHKDAHVLSHPYYAITEPLFFYPVFPYRTKKGWTLLRHHLYKGVRDAIRSNPGTLFFINLSNYPVVRFRNVLFVSRWYRPPFEERNPFRDRADAHQGTLAFQLSLAIFLGFKKAYLVGHDYTHFPSRSHHYYEKGEGVQTANRLFMRDFLAYARQHIELVTVTLGAGSETMQAVSYQDFTGRAPAYRENTELVDPSKLDILATWNGYSIY